MFRHGYVTALLDERVPPHHVSDYTGDDLGVLLSVYSHVTGSAFESDRSVIDGIGM
jgi:hypothetical protein